MYTCCTELQLVDCQTLTTADITADCFVVFVAASPPALVLDYERRSLQCNDYSSEPSTLLQPHVVRDTATVNALSYIVLRFVANNAGSVSIFHCHIDWHAAIGFGVLFKEGFPEVN
jgi:FtsP/CotA-like multicopper oxidase with cupredoxin domain